MSDLDLITARLKGMTTVEDVSDEVGFAALRIVVSGNARIEYATNGHRFNEMIQNVMTNHRAGYCFFADYDKHL